MKSAGLKDLVGACQEYVDGEFFLLGAIEALTDEARRIPLQPVIGERD